MRLSDYQPAVPVTDSANEQLLMMIGFAVCAVALVAALCTMQRTLLGRISTVSKAFYALSMAGFVVGAVGNFGSYANSIHENTVTTAEAARINDAFQSDFKRVYGYDTEATIDKVWFSTQSDFALKADAEPITDDVKGESGEVPVVFTLNADADAVFVFRTDSGEPLNDR